ncbi:hypothetical protein BDW22DRAFT_969680 [Trametopsis cervina]|nr:hypothetical protein BDW22DRAFT_969680 [Trametopsis cervina]
MLLSVVHSYLHLPNGCCSLYRVFSFMVLMQLHFALRFAFRSRLLHIPRYHTIYLSGIYIDHRNIQHILPSLPFPPICFPFTIGVTSTSQVPDSV